MKTRILSLLLVLALVCALLPQIVLPADAAGIAINETNFPDEQFRTYVSEKIDADRDDRLSASEIANTTTISVFMRSIESLKGIEYFTALEELYCDYNPLTTLDVSKNTALKSLSCLDNHLTALDVSKNTALTRLDCTSNQLTALDVSKNPALEWIWCPYNQLTALDVSENAALVFLHCANNQLTALDMGRNTALKEVLCMGNQIVFLDVSGAPALVDAITCGNRSQFDDDVVYSSNSGRIDMDAGQAFTAGAGAPSITGQPKSVSAALGAAATFRVTAAGSDLEYQWQYKRSGASKWIDWSGKTSAVLPVTAGTGNGGCQYRCKVSNRAGMLYSSAATLTVTLPKPTITTQPKSVSVALGSTATFKVVASGSGLKYQWQYKKSGATTWTDWAGKTAATLTVTASSTNGGCQYRCVVSNTAGSVTSSAATLTVITVKPTITTQPKSVSVAIGAAATFKVVASGDGLSYQWQKSADGGMTWSNCSSTGHNLANFSFKATEVLNGWLYRCVVTNCMGTVTSSAAKLTVSSAATAKPAITKQPAATTANVGDMVTLSAKASGGGLSYQWQKSADGGMTWSDCSSTGHNLANFSFKATEVLNGWRYRCVVTNSMGSVTSAAAKLTVTSSATAKPAITKQPSAKTANVGEMVTLSVKATGGGLTYQWQKSADGGVTWSDCASTGHDLANFSFKATEVLNGWRYRCVVKNSKGSVTSAAAKLTVSSAATAKPTITKQPAAATANVGETVTLSVKASGGGLSYQWQKSTDGGNTWSNCTSTGHDLAYFSFRASATFNGWRYRCVVTNTKGSVTSASAKVTVN